jgi:hypothetical protein
MKCGVGASGSHTGSNSSHKSIRNDPYKVSNAIIMEINFMAG